MLPAPRVNYPDETVLTQLNYAEFIRTRSAGALRVRRSSNGRAKIRDVPRRKPPNPMIPKILHHGIPGGIQIPCRSFNQFRTKRGVGDCICGCVNGCSCARPYSGNSHWSTPDAIFTTAPGLHCYPDFPWITSMFSTRCMLCAFFFFFFSFFFFFFKYILPIIRSESKLIKCFDS